MQQIVLCRIQTSIPHIRVAGKVVLGIKKGTAANLTNGWPEKNITPNPQEFGAFSQKRHARRSDYLPDSPCHLAQWGRYAPGAGVEDLVQLL
jgi:hypothetical protein